MSRSNSESGPSCPRRVWNAGWFDETFKRVCNDESGKRQEILTYECFSQYKFLCEELVESDGNGFCSLQWVLFLICKFNATNKLCHIYVPCNLRVTRESYIKFIEFWCCSSLSKQSNLEITNKNLVQDKKGSSLNTISGQNHGIIIIADSQQ